MPKKRHHHGHGMHPMKGHKNMTDNYHGMEAGMVHEGRKFEHEGSKMINEDRHAIANLPQEVKYHMWHEEHTGFNPDIDDTGTGIDRQVAGDYNQMKRHFKPRKA
jgi:hypothetical protein